MQMFPNYKQGWYWEEAEVLFDRFTLSSYMQRVKRNPSSRASRLNSSRTLFSLENYFFQFACLLLIKKQVWQSVFNICLINGTCICLIMSGVCCCVGDEHLTGCKIATLVGARSVCRQVRDRHVGGCEVGMSGHNEIGMSVGARSVSR